MNRDITSASVSLNATLYLTESIKLEEMRRTKHVLTALREPD